MGYNEGVKITIPIPEKISSNKIYAGQHWTKRKRWADEMHLMVIASNIKPYTGPFPVDCSYHFKLKGKLLDSSNTIFMQKLVEDGLVRAGVLPDDSRTYVRWVGALSDKAAKGEDNIVTVEFSPA